MAFGFLLLSKIMKLQIIINVHETSRAIPLILIKITGRSILLAKNTKKQLFPVIIST